LSEQPSVESREISEGVVLDYDESGNLVGIDIDNASRKSTSNGLSSAESRRGSKPLAKADALRARLSISTELRTTRRRARRV
jgi:uncharacterized protein YuzE